MHICYITAEYPIKELSHGGVGTFTRSLSYKLIEKGVAVSVIRLANVNEEQFINDNGVHVYLIPEEKKWPFKFIWNSIKVNKKILEIHSKEPISIVETPELGLAFLNKIKGVKFIIRMHGGHHFFTKAENRSTEWKKVWQEKRSFKRADHVIAVSKYVAETTRQLLHLGSRKIDVIYNPIDTSRFYQSDKSKVEPHTIFFAGSIIEKKGIRQLVESLEYLVDDYPDVKLKIAGRDAIIPGTNKPYRPVLEKSISDKIKPHVEFLGSIPNFEIPMHIEKAQICCYPSHMEAMPLAWLEVLAMGKIFIGSTTGPGPETVIDNETGFLVNPHEPIAIANKIKYIFENYTNAVQVGQNARKRILEEFDLNNIVNKNVACYKSIV
jgi:glycosyltransferase involved in cell wall biosynthesis